MRYEGKDVLLMLRIPRNDFAFEPLGIEYMNSSEVDIVLYEFLVGFEDLNPKVDVDEQHGGE